MMKFMAFGWMIGTGIALLTMDGVSLFTSVSLIVLGTIAFLSEIYE